MKLKAVSMQANAIPIDAVRRDSMWLNAIQYTPIESSAIDTIENFFKKF